MVWRDVPAVLWARHTWLAVAALLAGAVLWLVPVALVTAMVWGGLELGGAVGAMAPLAVAVPVLLALTSRFTVWHGVRLRLLGADLARPAARPPGMSRRRWLARRVVSSATWRQISYHALGGTFLALACTVVLAGGVFGPGFIVAAALSGKGSLLHRSPIAALGAAMAIAAAWLARGAAALDLALARRLLQPPPAELLARRVALLSASRAAAVEAADAERRRIERDLHDGTQQRLVSLAMNLGMTRAAVADADPAVRAAVVAAHEEAKQALVELRDLIRGLHPAVLDELGLDAALSGIAARSPVPVRLVVDLRGRPPAAIEAVAYFVVSEALSNVAKHAAATRADVVVRQQLDGLTLAVADDGRGGADPVRGTGLRGLRQRVESVDGTLSIASPAGGPTSILVTLPCG